MVHTPGFSGYCTEAASMKMVWRFYKRACVIILTAGIALGLVISGFLTVHSGFSTPVADVPSPDHTKRIRIFTAGQGDFPPDYRADVQFYLYDETRMPMLRYTLIASAPYADGWNVNWTSAQNVTIMLGPRSWVQSSITQAGGVMVHIVVADRSQDEASCISATFDNPIDGVDCQKNSTSLPSLAPVFACAVNRRRNLTPDRRPKLTP
jgi:hypothetical protein